jgi:hypothetical protein
MMNSAKLSCETGIMGRDCMSRRAEELMVAARTGSSSFNYPQLSSHPTEY